jgi:uncharacterized protein
MTAVTSIIRLVRLALLAGVFLGLVSPSAVRAEVPIPALTGRVVDTVGVLSATQRQELERALASLESRKGSQVAVLLVDTTQPESIEQFALRVAEEWKLGRRGVDDGVLLVLAMGDRALRLEVGYGLEGSLSDVIASRIIREIITPELRAGNTFEGIRKGLAAVQAVLEGEELPAPSKSTEGDPFGALLMLPLMFGSVLRKALGRPGSAALSFVLAASLGALFGYLWLGVIAGVIVGLIMLFSSEYIVGGRSRSRGGWSSSGGSFGGFSGGGGSFGGGGASGRW